MKNKIFIVTLAVILILSTFISIREISETRGAVNIFQYDATKIQKIHVLPLETYIEKELNINDSRKIEEFTHFINSLRLKSWIKVE